MTRTAGRGRHARTFSPISLQILRKFVTTPFSVLADINWSNRSFAVAATVLGLFAILPDDMHLIYSAGG